MAKHPCLDRLKRVRLRMANGASTAEDIQFVQDLAEYYAAQHVCSICGDILPEDSGEEVSCDEHWCYCSDDSGGHRLGVGCL